MVLGVGRNRMPGIEQLAHAFRVGLGLAPDQEEGRLHALRGEDVEDLVAVYRDRAVVEGQHHLAVVERQRLAILHRADQRMRFGIDYKSAGSSERVGTRAIGRKCRRSRRAGGKSQHYGEVRNADANSCITGHRTPPAFRFRSNHYRRLHECRINYWSYSRFSRCPTSATGLAAFSGTTCTTE